MLSWPFPNFMPKKFLTRCSQTPATAANLHAPSLLVTRAARERREAARTKAALAKAALAVLQSRYSAP